MLKILNREADKQIKREPVGGILKKRFMYTIGKRIDDNSEKG